MTGPDPVWVQAQSDRVMRTYQAYMRRSQLPADRCNKPCWPDGPPCELDRHHDEGVCKLMCGGGECTTVGCVIPTEHVAPSIAQQPGIKFVGPVPSSRKGQPPYTVTVYDEPTQRATCTCEGYTKYRRGQDCSHIRLVREALASS